MGDLEQAAAFLFQEARHLDRHEWDAWVAMYREDAVYWLPAWRDEYETTADPQTEVSLIFHNARLGLEERIARIESRKSITALPLPRTLHQIGNVELRAAGSGVCRDGSHFRGACLRSADGEGTHPIWAL
jgi:3-phenylpropionate/cinnamic acid dioxygenase small subunit